MTSFEDYKPHNKYKKKIKITSLYLLIISLILAFCGIGFAQDGRLAYYSKDGETLENIAFKNKVDLPLLAAVNNIKENTPLKTGTKIWIPLEPVQTIIVAKGDTLWSLAKKHNTTVDHLISINALENPDKLKIGQSLKFPIDNSEVSENPIVVATTERPSQTVASRGNSEFAWPLTGTITSCYGQRKSGNHHGLDIAAKKGTLIKAAASGKVTFAGWRSNIYGYCVIIQHDNNRKTVYAHASQVLVKKGQTVKTGDSIAKVGSTGNATGNHLHFEIHINDVTVDPQKYLR